MRKPMWDWVNNIDNLSRKDTDFKKKKKTETWSCNEKFVVNDDYTLATFFLKTTFQLEWVLLIHNFEGFFKNKEENI